MEFALGFKGKGAFKRREGHVLYNFFFNMLTTKSDLHYIFPYIYIT